MNWLQKVSQNDYRLYQTGMCDVMAIALHRLTGKLLGLISGEFEEDGEIFYEDAHAVVLMGGNQYLDVTGLHSGIPDNVMFSNPNITRVVIRPCSEQEMLSAFTSEVVQEDDIQRAMTFAMNSPVLKQFC